MSKAHIQSNLEDRSGSNSVVESQPSKLLVASSILVSRSIDMISQEETVDYLANRNRSLTDIDNGIAARDMQLLCGEPCWNRTDDQLTGYLVSEFLESLVPGIMMAPFCICDGADTSDCPFHNEGS